MQQTENLKLNLIETGDPISPAPINENAQKIEAALTSEIETRQAETADLDQRVTVLEARKIVFGTYKGDGKIKTIDLGFAPVAVYCSNLRFQTEDRAMALRDNDLIGATNDVALTLTDIGFTVRDIFGHDTLNRNAATYCYIAFG